MCLILGVLFVHGSKCVFGIALLGTLFNKYMTIFKEYIHKDTGKVEFLNILLIISIEVLLCLSDRLFCYGVPSIVYCTQMPCFFKEFSKWTWVLPSFIVSFVILTTSTKPKNSHIFV